MNNSIVVKPCRNVVLFNGMNCPIDICNIYIKTIFEILSKLVPDMFINHKTKFEIRANEFNYSLKIIGNCSYFNIVKIIENNKTNIYKLVHLSHYEPFITTPKIYINNFFKYQYTLIDKIYTLFYNSLSFRQPDDNMQPHIVNYVIKYVENMKNIVFIGGEMTLFGKILKYNRGLFLTDMQSILNDTNTNIILNYNNNDKKAVLVNYEKDNIKDLINNYMVDLSYCTIINTSIKGMGEHLVNEIIKTLTKFIVIISCSKKSFYKDQMLLAKGGLYLKEEIIITSNYDIGVYKLTT